jgi:hypothetical protein
MNPNLPIPHVSIYPYREANMFQWPYVYLHGNAELVYEQPRNAPDLFSADCAMPKQETNVFCMVGNEPALAVIRMHYGILGGRVALLSDTDALKHALTPEKWG